MKGLQTLYNEWVMYEYKSSVKYNDVLNEFFKLLPDKDKNDIDGLLSEAVLPEIETAFFAGFKMALGMFTEEPGCLSR